MHHDSLINDQMIESKEDHGPHDVGSCPLFVRDVDASESSNQDRTGKLCMIVGSWPTIIAQSWPSICLL